MTERNKLFLFDIDGTILSPGPAARMIINEEIEAFTGTSPDLQFKDVAGLTDRLIIRNALQKCGMDGEIPQLIPIILDNYLTKVEGAYSASSEAFVYDDAIKLIERIKTNGYPMGLLTGNVKRGAEIKLGRFDLMKHFAFGAYGDDAEIRSELPIIARNRAQEVLGKSFEFKDVILIGDTPEDAQAAKVNGCKSIIVCRRKMWYNEIIKAGADLIVERLDDPVIVI